MKAYKVSCKDDDHGAKVVFAESGKDADRSANCEMCDCPWIERTIHRAAKFDKYAPGPVTVAQYLAEGWYWSCARCSEQVWGEDGPAIITDRDTVFCSDGCLRSLLRRYRELGPTAHQSILDAVASMERWLAVNPTDPAPPEATR